MSLPARGIADPHPHYGASGITIQKEELHLPFPVRVIFVDGNRPAISVESQFTHEVFVNVTKFPVAASSRTATGMDLPEQGALGMAMYDSWKAGTRTVAVICWIPSDMAANQDAIAMRAVDDPAMEGFSTRWRGVHRRPAPGQRSYTNSHGFHEFIDSGWNRIARDLSEDLLDTDRREQTRSTGRIVDYTEAGLRFRGPINRPGADPATVPAEMLPDGTTRQVVFLRPGTTPASRYLDGAEDMLPFTESLERVQEFGLDHPVPREILETDYLDGLLGIGAAAWARTNVVTQDGKQRDDQDFLADQGVDHPHDGTGAAAVGPSTREGTTPRRRGWIAEQVTGTLVGYHRPDKTTYGKVLKPVLFPLTTAGRFATSPETGFRPVVDSPDHGEARLAAVAHLTRFPYDYNTTRWMVTKEGQVLFEVGATIPRENNGFDGGLYEHPWGAGRSIEGHVVGSTRLVLGKNRDEETSLDVAALGQVILRLGADDGSLPDDGRQVHAQNRAQGDAVTQRSLQYWKQPSAVPKENVSLRAATDGGIFLRLGARNPTSTRRHLRNGYSDGQGLHKLTPGTGDRASTDGRPVYDPGDANYLYHDLINAAQPQSSPPELLYHPAGDCIGDINAHGLSADVHAVQDIFLRVGKNAMSNYSLLLDFAGGIIGIVGKDKKGRSLTSTFEGGVEMSIGKDDQGQSMGLEIMGDVNWLIKGNWHVQCHGDMVFDSMGSIYTLAKKNLAMKGLNVYSSALVKVVQEAPDLPKNQGWSASPPLLGM